MKLENIKYEILQIEFLFDSGDYKKKTPLEKLEVIKRYVELADKENEIEPYNKKKQRKIRIIRNAIEKIETLNELQIKNYNAYLRVKERIKKQLGKMFWKW